MYISKFRIRNYKSYYDSTEVSLQSGINIITGQNNVGKTAMLEALSFNFDDHRHKSTKTKPTSISPLNDPPIIEVELHITKRELISFIYEFLPQITLPYPADQNINKYNGGYFFNEVIEENNIIYFVIQSGGTITSAYLKKLGFNSTRKSAIYAVNKGNQTLQLVSPSENLSSFYFIAEHFKSRIYFFVAQRYSISHHMFGKNKVLTSNASNLPEVLGILQSEKLRFRKYLEYVRQVFPQIIDISIRPHNIHDKHQEILIQNEELPFERSDLLIPLAESGTGIGQVLAILYVVLTTDIPKTIIIDEPNSFLHPGAAKKLIEILKLHPQHQFIISTHSPSTIAAANPKTISIIRTQNAQSYIESIDLKEANKQQLYLAEIGAKLSDVFGADNILWVEGKTEEICLPKIIEATEGISLMGTSIIGVKNTGDFQGKRPELVFEIYKRLSNGGGLMPSSVGFIFDKENLTPNAIADLKRKSNKLVFFINRMMYENYLLNSKAIYNILRGTALTKENDITEEKVNDWIKKNKWRKEFIDSKYSEKKDEKIWLEQVHAGNFLKKMFSDLTDNKLEYDKITHSVALTEWIIENSIEDLKEIQDLLKSILIK